MVGTLLMIAVYLLVRAGGELHRFTDLTEAEVQAVGEEASGVWETGQAEGGRDLKSGPLCRSSRSVRVSGRAGARSRQANFKESVRRNFSKNYIGGWWGCFLMKTPYYKGFRLICRFRPNSASTT
ncbi:MULTISPECIES: hypothetical protein [Burkholderiaceae]|uniref:hypothetical protein n=1 Tax=Burkholderiaceae TaxID=119060 RepID=UPI0014226E79|nr:MULTISPECIES: hypothetical protein [Burkholderiaceae]MBN3849023.1 hypothetical protein [Paraburkholderia sp. Ac-20342]NIF52387.1 hypothetical protein [Burkholderia sp. Ax-1724]NIF80291.1 hypothetical protein [Paraburkholderia sp. Cy-641]